MGTYVYTLRKKTTKIDISIDGVAGRVVDANFLSFAYKPWRSLWADDRRSQARIDRYDRMADEAYHSDRSGYVVVADAGDDLAGAAVYRNLASPIWYDTDPIPAVPVGFLHRVGRRWVVRPHDQWQRCSVDGRVVERRMVVVDGEFHTQSRPVASKELQI